MIECPALKHVRPCSTTFHPSLSHTLLMSQAFTLPNRWLTVLFLSIPCCHVHYVLYVHSLTLTALLLTPCHCAVSMLTFPKTLAYLCELCYLTNGYALSTYQICGQLKQSQKRHLHNLWYLCVCVYLVKKIFFICLEALWSRWNLP